MEFAELLTGLIAIGSGGLVALAMTGLKKASTWVENLPKRAKQALVLVIAFAVGQLEAWLGIPLPLDALHWSADVINNVIVALLSFGTYNVAKLPKPKA
jgi:hypothetical protein